MEQLDGVRLDRATASPIRTVAAATDHTEEVLVRRAQFLADDDRKLFIYAVTARLSNRRMAELFGLPVSTVSRRLKKLHRLLTEPHIVHLLEGPCHLEPADRQIAVAYFLHGRTLKELAALHDMRVGQVARRVEYFKGWINGARGKGG
jgi:DNA-directed RNA polymerase specialized sigma24 family protein